MFMVIFIAMISFGCANKTKEKKISTEAPKETVDMNAFGERCTSLVYGIKRATKLMENEYGVQCHTDTSYQADGMEYYFQYAPGMGDHLQELLLRGYDPKTKKDFCSIRLFSKPHSDKWEGPVLDEKNYKRMYDATTYYAHLHM